LLSIALYGEEETGGQNIAFLTKNFLRFQTEKAALPATMTI